MVATSIHINSVAFSKRLTKFHNDLAWVLNSAPIGRGRQHKSSARSTDRRDYTGPSDLKLCDGGGGILGTRRHAAERARGKTFPRKRRG